MGISSAQRQLDQFLSRYTDDVARQARKHLAGLRRRLPTAVQFVYDNYNALVIGFGQTERPSEAVLSLALYPRYVSLCFLHGAKLPDPDRRLEGSGNQVRHIRLTELNSLDDPQVDALIKRRAFAGFATSVASSILRPAALQHRACP